MIESQMRYGSSGIGGNGPALWWGPDAPDGDFAAWLEAPVGSIYVYKPSALLGTLYVKTAANGADADWQSAAGVATNGALLLGQGTSAAPVSTSTAAKNFLQYYVKSTATTAGSDTRAAYLRLYLSGATTGGGEALRAFTTVEAAIGTAHGAHISLNFGASGSVSGQAIAMRGTLHLPAGTATGTVAAVQGEIYLDAATSAPPSGSHGIFRGIVAGDATNVAAVKNLFLIEGVQATAASSGVADMVTTGCADATSTVRIKVRINSTDYWLLANAAAPSA